MFEAEREFGDPHPKHFAIHVGEGIFAVGADSFCDVVLVPGEDADGSAVGDKVQAELHLTAEPDVIPDDAIFCWVGATLPNLTTKQEGAGLDRHMPVGIDGEWNGDLVEEIEEV